MITITYRKVIDTTRLIANWKAMEVQRLDDGTIIRTYLEVKTDKESHYTGAWFNGISNPLTQLKNSGRIRYGSD